MPVSFLAFSSEIYTIIAIIVAGVIWGLPFLFWPFTYIKDSWNFAHFYVRWYDYIGNWVGVVAAIVNLVLFIIDTVNNSTSDTAHTIMTIVYGIVMAVIQFLTWRYLQPLLQYYMNIHGQIEEPEPEVEEKVDVSPFVDFHRQFENIYTF